jgi:hypothetical protein
MRQTRSLRLVVLLTASAAVGCDDHKLEIAKVLVQYDLADGGPLVFNIGSCEGQVGALPIDRSCVIDSTGKSHTGQEVVTLAAAPPYAAYVLFMEGFIPQAADLGTTGPDASIGAWVLPCRAELACSTDGPGAYRISTFASLTYEGGLLVTIRDAVPEGSQVLITLDLGALFRSRISSPAANGGCDLPSPSFCSGAAATGFAIRFYVGRAPAGVGADGPPAPPTAAGTCLLSYNTALSGDDPCCYRLGGRNTCDQGIRCNDRSGSSCCTIYASEATQHGQRCCLYEGGGGVDGADECATLLGEGR